MTTRLQRVLCPRLLSRVLYPRAGCDDVPRRRDCGAFFARVFFRVFFARAFFVRAPQIGAPKPLWAHRVLH